MVDDKFDRKELQHDPFRDVAFEFIHFVYEQRRWFIGGGIALFAIVALVAGGLAYQRHAEREESEALLQATRTMRNTSTTPEAKWTAGTKAFQAFVAEYPRSALAPVAWLYLARIAWEQKELDRSAQAFQHVLDHRKVTPLLRTEALVGLGKIKEAQGKPAEAKAHYEQIGEGFQDLKQLSLGRAALAAGDLQAAREHFLQAAGAQGYTGVTIQAREALDFLP